MHTKIAEESAMVFRMHSKITSLILDAKWSFLLAEFIDQRVRK
jgi:hypothetical protein